MPLVVDGGPVDEATPEDRRQVHVGVWRPDPAVPPRMPLIVVPGAAMTGAEFTVTADGTEGWAQQFARAGHPVYLLDPAGRGRSPPSPGLRQLALPPEWVAATFTAPARGARWPHAAAHTQWPGDGVPGDPAFDALYARLGPTDADAGAAQRAYRAAVVSLLDRIGPAALVVHSQGGMAAWLAADARPALVTAIVAVEPSGPPFRELRMVGAPDWFADGAITKPYGLTSEPLAFDPPAPGGLDLERQAVAEGPGLARCWLQREPASQLPCLADLPILVLTAEASYHAPYDHCTVAFLRQAGARRVEFRRLEDHAIRGNGHAMMLERNAADIARVIVEWLASTS